MAWNQPGNNKDEGNENKDPNNDPNKDRENDIWHRRRQQNPPNLDEMFGKMYKKMLAVLSNKSGGSSSNKVPNFLNASGIGIGVLIIFLLWVISGIYIVGPAEQGVVLRFGKYIETVDPGPHWLMRFIDTKYIVNVSLVQGLDYSAKMLTRDTNIVDVQFTIRYRVSNAKDFLFNVVNPKGSLEQATASAVRQVIGQTSMDAVISSDRQQVQDKVESILKQTMGLYNTGLSISQVTFQSANPPQEVADAFDDVTKAKEDEKRYIKEAETYKASILPIAKGQASQMLALAKADQQKTILAAQGNIASYLALLPEYKKAPKITEKRLYFDALENVLSNNVKILLDTGNSNNVIYLPLDRAANNPLPDVNNIVSTNNVPTTPGFFATPLNNPPPAPTIVKKRSLANYGDNSQGAGQ